MQISFQPLVQCLDVDNLIKLFTAVLLERRILLRSNKYAPNIDMLITIIALVDAFSHCQHCMITNCVLGLIYRCTVTIASLGHACAEPKKLLEIISQWDLKTSRNRQARLWEKWTHKLILLKNGLNYYIGPLQHTQLCKNWMKDLHIMQTNWLWPLVFTFPTFSEFYHDYWNFLSFLFLHPVDKIVLCIIVCRYSLLTLASEAICHLIYPFRWQVIWIC